MHVAAKRKNNSGKFIAALKIFGTDPNIFYNNLKEISDGDEIIKVGQLPVDNSKSRLDRVFHSVRVS